MTRNVGNGDAKLVGALELAEHRNPGLRVVACTIGEARGEFGIQLVERQW